MWGDKHGMILVQSNSYPGVEGRYKIMTKNPREEITDVAYAYPLGTRRCCDVESTSLTLIQRRINVVCPVGIHLTTQQTQDVELLLF